MTSSSSTRKWEQESLITRTHTRVKKATKLFKERRIQGKNSIFALVQRAFGKKSAPASSPKGLLSLPNELLLQIVRYLVPTVNLFKAEGYGWLAKSPEYERPVEAHLRKARAAKVKIMLDLALTCRRLAPIVQRILYVSVLLLQPQQVPDQGQIWPSSLMSFFRTMIDRPDLAARVQELRVWIWKGKAVNGSGSASKVPVCHYRDCMHRFETALVKLRVSDEEEMKWKEALLHPTDSLICGLILGNLPKLSTLALYARSSDDQDSSTRGILRQDIPRVALDDTTEVDFIAQGLAVTHVHDLSLSSNLNGLHRARLPSLSKLYLDYSREQPFTVIEEGCFINVTSLTLDTNPTECNPRLCWHSTLTKKSVDLIKKLPNLRTIEFDGAQVAWFFDIPSYIETIVLHYIDWRIFQCSISCLIHRNRRPTALRCIEAHWRDDCMFYLERELGRCSSGILMAKDAGIIIRVFWRGGVYTLTEPESESLELI